MQKVFRCYYKKISESVHIVNNNCLAEYLYKVQTIDFSFGIETKMASDGDTSWYHILSSVFRVSLKFSILT